MAKRNVTVGGNEVRVWGLDNRPELVSVKRDGEKFARGRIRKELVEAYQEANPTHVYVPGHKTERTFELTERTQDSKGRNRSRKVEVTLSRVRELAGEVCAQRGIPSAAAIEAASDALSAEAQARKSAKASA